MPLGPKTTAPYAFERTSSIPTPGWAATAATRPGMELLELLDRESVVVAGEPDEARGCPSRRRRSSTRSATGISSSSSSRSTTPSVVLLGQRGARDGRPDALALGDLRQERVDEDRPFGLASSTRPGRPAAHQAADVLAEAHAVALEERLAEALAVVGQDDELVRPRRLVGRLDQGRDRRGRRRRAPRTTRPARVRSGGRARRSR